MAAFVYSAHYNVPNQEMILLIVKKCSDVIHLNISFADDKFMLPIGSWVI